MKTTIPALVILLGCSAIAQTNQPAVEDFKPSSLNQPGKQYPQVNSERRVRRTASLRRKPKASCSI